MTHIDFYFDPISPYAYLAFERLPEALQGLSYSVSYRPVLFAGMLAHHGQKGPAEIEPKRAWTFRQVPEYNKTTISSPSVTVTAKSKSPRLAAAKLIVARSV